MMRFVLRTDVSKSSGAGHLMRCIAIFEEVKRRGYQTIFVGSVVDIVWAKQRVADFGFSQIIDNPKDFLGVPDTDVLIIDSYLIPVDDPFLSKQLWKKIIAISDESTPSYEVDLIVYPTLKQLIKISDAAQVLFGPEYFPIRNEVKKIKYFDSKSDIIDFIVVGGGVDYKDFSEVIAKNLMKVKSDFTANFISNNKSIEKMDSRFKVFILGTHIDSLVSETTLALTTASLSAIEFIAREVPTGIVRVIDNQSDYFEYLSLQNLAIPIGELRDGFWIINNDKILDLIGNLNLQSRLRLNMSGLIDLKGPERIVNRIIQIST